MCLSLCGCPDRAISHSILEGNCPAILKPPAHELHLLCVSTIVRNVVIIHFISYKIVSPVSPYYTWSVILISLGTLPLKVFDQYSLYTCRSRSFYRVGLASSRLVRFVCMVASRLIRCALIYIYVIMRKDAFIEIDGSKGLLGAG